MDSEVTFEKLTAKHLYDVEYVEARSELESVRIWSKNSLPGFFGNVTPPTTNTIFVRVTSTDDAEIEHLQTHVQHIWETRIKNSNFSFFHDWMLSAFMIDAAIIPKHHTGALHANYI